MYKNEESELVEEFKYLGVVFSHNGTFKKCNMYMKDQATKAMFALLSKGRRLKLERAKHSFFALPNPLSCSVMNKMFKPRLKLPIDVMLDLFDKTVLPVLLYGCEVLRKEHCARYCVFKIL